MWLQHRKVRGPQDVFCLVWPLSERCPLLVAMLCRACGDWSGGDRLLTAAIAQACSLHNIQRGLLKLQLGQKCRLCCADQGGCWPQQTYCLRAASRNNRMVWSRTLHCRLMGSGRWQHQRAPRTRQGQACTGARVGHSQPRPGLQQRRSAGPRASRLA